MRACAKTFLFMIIEDDNLDLIILAALRYSFNRRTYIGFTVQSFIRDHWESFNKQMRELVILDIKRFVDSDEGDIDEWEKFLKTLN